MTTPRVIVCSLVLLLASRIPAQAQGNPPAPKPAPVRTAPVRDSLPSPEALRVLDRIPEPLPASQQVPPPAGVRASAPVEAADSLRVEDTTDSSAAGVPVPAPTQPLAQPSSPGLVMPDTLPPPVAAPPVTTAPATHAAPGTNGECWRVQVAAPEQRDMAESRREAAQSLLLVPMTIETEGALHKVRTRDCLTREAADAIKRRAVDSGFVGVFLVNTAARPAAPAHHVAPAPHHAPAKRAARPAPRRHRK